MFTDEIKRGRSKRPLVMGLTFVALVAAVLFLVPMPRMVKSTFVLAPATSVDVVATREGTLSEVVSGDGATVARGAVIARYETGEAPAKLATLQQALEALEKQQSAGVKPNPRARAALAKADAALKAATAALEKAVKAARGKKSAAVLKAEKKHQAAQATQLKAKAAAVTPEEVEAQLAAAREALSAARAQLAQSDILAPASGVLSLAGLEKGRAVKAGEKVAVVGDTSRLKAVVKVPPGESLVKGQALELVLPKKNRRVLLDADARGDVAEAAFDNAKGELSTGLTGVAEIEGAQRPLISF